MYADDTQIYIDTTTELYTSAIQTLEKCIKCVQKWMQDRQLKMNDAKTEFIVFASRELAKRLPSSLQLCVGSHLIQAKDSVRNIGVMFDSRMTLEKHVNYVCRSAFLQLRAIVKVTAFTNRQTLEVIIHAILLHLDLIFRTQCYVLLVKNCSANFSLSKTLQH